MYPFPPRLHMEKVYHTAEGHAAAIAAANCVLPQIPHLPPMMVPRMTAPLPPVFSMNPASYENAENVDWAALAQQWIHMQDTSAPPPSAPPPPTFTRTLAQVQRPIYEEKGEADMEVDMNTTDEPSYYETPSTDQWHSGSWPPPPPQQQQQLNSHKGYMTAPIIPAPVGTNESLVTTIGNGPNNTQWAPPPVSATTPLLFNPNAPPPQFNVSSLQATQPPRSQPGRGGHHQHKQSYSKLPLLPRSSPTVMNELIMRGQEEKEEEEENVLDAAKRKNLPAWIREGLEKMEREKSRQEEREKEIQTREQQLLLKKQVEKEAMADLEAIKQKRLLEENKKLPLVDNADSASSEDDEKPPPSPVVKRKLTTEEKMRMVRQTLTEILLEVTNVEIGSVAREVKQWYQKKVAKEKAKNKPVHGINPLTKSLGLAAYANSDSEDDEEEDSDDDDKGEQPENDVDSEEELKETIRRKKFAFRAIARDMEDEMAEQAARVQRGKRAATKRSGGKDGESDSDEDENGGNVDDDKEKKFGNGGDVELEKRKNRERGSMVGVNNSLSSSSLTSLTNDRDDGEPTPQSLIDRNSSRNSGAAAGGRWDRKASRFSVPGDTVRGLQVTHVNLVKLEMLYPKPGSASKEEASEVEPVDKSVVAKKREDDDRSVCSSTSSRRRDSDKGRDRERRRSRDRDDERRRKESRRRSRSRSRDSRSTRDRSRDRDSERRRRSRSKSGDRRRRNKSRSRERDSRKKRH